MGHDPRDVEFARRHKVSVEDARAARIQLLAQRMGEEEAYSSRPAAPPPKKRLSYPTRLAITGFVLLGIFSCSALVRESKKPLTAEQQVAAEKVAAQKVADDRAALATAQAAAEACRTNLKCVGEKYIGHATGPCTRLVERLAKNTFRWIDGWTEPKLSNYAWANKKKGTIAYLGDKIEFQNGFGAWIRHTYRCDFDPASESIIDVSAEQGRL